MNFMRKPLKTGRLLLSGSKQNNAAWESFSNELRSEDMLHILAEEINHVIQKQTSK